MGNRYTLVKLDIEWGSVEVYGSRRQAYRVKGPEESGEVGKVFRHRDEEWLDDLECGKKAAATFRLEPDWDEPDV